jgi:iron-sulfur cluster assembly accessory protein
MEETRDDAVEIAIKTGAVPPALQIRLTDTACARAKAMAADHAGEALRYYIEGKGCDGFFYGVAFDTPTPRDLRYEQDGLPVAVDPESLRFMYASEVEWVDDERGQGFLVTNPNHRRFRGKFYKKSAWKDRLTASAPASSSR